MKLKQVLYYTKDNIDENGEVCYLAPYHEVKLFRDDKVIAHYGSYYSDKGTEKIQGFIDGLKYITGEEITIEEKIEVF